MILDRLRHVEHADKVRIVYACESGSRAWGFASADSDYDVRFIYVHRQDWYLSIEPHRDVIELPIEGDLDINGWDLKKALSLFRKSNPPLLEWLGSPLVYIEETPVAAWLRDLLPTFYSPRACMHHYLRMSRHNFRSYLKGDVVIRKKYLYVLRPIVAILWIERGLGVVPTQFKVAVDEVVEDPAVREAIATLVEEKRAGREMDHGPHLPELTHFIIGELERLESCLLDVPRSSPDWAILNDLFRSSLQAAWQGVR